MSNQALIIIDQQQGIDHPKLGDRNNPSAEIVILKLLKQWRDKSLPIIHVKHRSKDRESVFWPHQEGFDFKLGFEPQNGEFTIEKKTPCAFTNTSLLTLLQKHNINSFVLVGVATNNSIESTARTGGNLELDVTVIGDACFAFSKHDYFGTPRTADEVHAMSLANLSEEYANILHSSNFLCEKPNKAKHNAPKKRGQDGQQVARPCWRR